MPRDRVTKALIPAAGRGTRFLPFTKSVPKELLPIVSTPALELVVAEASRNRLTDVILVLGEGKQAIADYFAPHPSLEAVLAANGDTRSLATIKRAANLATIHQVEQLEPRGLGDAVAHGERFADGDPLAVLLPDDLIDERDELLGPMLDVYEEHGGIVLALLDVPRPEIYKYGVVTPIGEPAGDVVAIRDLVEKPTPEQAPSTLGPGAKGEIQLTDAMRRLAHTGVPVHGVVFHGRRYDTGDRLDYVRAVVQLAARHPDIGAQFTMWLREYVRESLRD